LRSAAADILASATSDRVTLTVRYSTYAPSDVTVGYWLKGTRGALQLGTEREHFAATGLVHLSERLDAGAMAKARAARAFIVSLKVPAAPAYCDRYAIRRLTLRRVRDGQTEWLRPNSASG